MNKHVLSFRSRLAGLIPNYRHHAKVLRPLLPAILLLLITLITSMVLPHTAVRAQDGFAHDAFRTLWERNDRPVAENALGQFPRSWTWGEAPLTEGMYEPFAGTPDGARLVQYFDKSRMEISADGEVTSGLLVMEMIEGRIQIGPETYEEKRQPNVVVVGDPREHNPNAPTYRTFSQISFPINPDPAPRRTNEVAIDVLMPDGTVVPDAGMAGYAIVYDYYDETLGHNTVQVFSNFFARHGMVYENGRYSFGPLIRDWPTFVGLPISEPYWVNVKIGGVEQVVLVQAFQRRIMTYNPNNPLDWEVEWGNVGQHYLEWRYGEDEPGETETITPTQTITETAVPEPVETETAEPVETETTEPEPVETETSEPEPVETETTEPEPVETETSEPEPVETETTEPEPVETETTEPEPVETETTEPEPVETETTEPEPVETETTEPEPVETETTEPEPVETAEPAETPERTPRPLPTLVPIVPDGEV